MLDPELQEMLIMLELIINKCYSEPYDPNYNYDQFIEDYNEILTSLPMVELELKFLEDNCKITVNRNYNEDSQNSENERNCSICYSNYEVNKCAVIMPGCHHVFHLNCLSEWLKLKPLCPNCKRAFRIEVIRNKVAAGCISDSQNLAIV